MAADYNVFISWSGERSRVVAEALREWLPRVIQASVPWMSDTDLEKGTRGDDEIMKASGGIKIGIVCLTPENLCAPWLLFEAGRLSRTVNDDARVYTYLFGGLEARSIQRPLGMFQGTKAEKEDTRKMLHGLNRALGIVLKETDLDVVFDRMWDTLAEALGRVPMEESAQPPKRSPDEVLTEILELVRGLSRRSESSSLGAALMGDLPATLEWYKRLGEALSPPATYRPSGSLKGLLNLAEEAEIPETQLPPEVRRRGTLGKPEPRPEPPG